MKRLTSIFLLLALVTLSSRAPAAEFSAVGALNFNRGAGAPTGAVGWASGTTFGGGVLLGQTANPFINLEGGFMFMPREYTEGFLQYGFSTLEFPVMLRVTALPILSFAAGGYYARVVDHKGTDLIINDNDAGLGLSVAVRFPIAPMIGLLFDGRYMHGLTNLDKRGTTLNRRDFQILGGLSFSL